MRRLRPRALILVAIAAAGVWSAIHLGLGPARLIPSPGAWELLGRFFGAALQPALVSESGSGSTLLPNVIEGTRATVVFAAAGMSLSLLIGIVLGFLASSTWWSRDRSGGRSRTRIILRRAVGPTVYAAARLLIAVMRSVHELLWALLILGALGLNNVNAVIALAIPYGGTLAKVFSEMLDEAPRDSADALRVLGATRLQAFAFGLLPRALPDMGAYAFYRFECALRSSAILGFFGFPTLGYHIRLSFENLYYAEVWTYLYALFLMVVFVDWWSGALRTRLKVV